MPTLNFTPADFSISAPELRHQVRTFLQASMDEFSPLQRARSWTGFDANFSRKLGAQGWIGMQWPRKYGGDERSALERYIVIEELLAAGAPVGAHWIADRQSGTVLLRYAKEEICRQYLPKIAAGELFFCIGMSEPNAGSDLASIKTRARRTDNGWVINGAKLWTTHVHRAHMMIALVRTGSAKEGRHSGLSQFLIDLSLPGVTVNAITDQTGDQHFGEVFLDDVLLPDNCLLGVEGEGWQQVNAELSLERSGPERYMSSYRLLEDYIAALAPEPDDSVINSVGEMVSELWTLRSMSCSVAERIANDEQADLEAAIVKDLGACFEQDIPQKIQAASGADIKPEKRHSLKQVLHYLLSAAPSFSLRGGTREILRGIIARGLGLR